MRSFAFYQVDAFLRTGSAQDGEAHGARHLHCRAADSAAGAVNENCFRRAGFRRMV